MKIFIALAFVAILGALAFAGVAMVRNKEDQPKKPTMMRALAWRVALSVALFLCILISYKLGWIQPTGIQAR
jgi:hypothetical protein